VVASAIALAVGVVVVAHMVMLDLVEQGDVYGDALHYVRMVDHEPVPAPYRWRVLAPWVAGALPLDPLDGLQVVTYASLVVAYAGAVVCARRLGSSAWAAALALVAVVSRTPHLYQFENPFLSDGAAIGSVGVAALAITGAAFTLFALACAVGVLAREPIALAVAAWLPTREWRRTATVAVLVGVAFAAAFVLGPGDGETAYVQGNLNRLGFAARCVWSWSFLWVAPMGLAMVADVRVRNQLLALTAALTAFAVVGSQLFTDTYRMFQPLVPCLVIGIALVMDRLGAVAAVALTALSATGWLLHRASRLQVTDETELVRLGTLVLGLAIVAVAWRQRRPDSSSTSR
jgi:hypothetical protein